MSQPPACLLSPSRLLFFCPKASSSCFSRCHCHTFKEEVLSASSEVSCSQSRHWDLLMMILSHSFYEGSASVSVGGKMSHWARHPLWYLRCFSCFPPHPHSGSFSVDHQVALSPWWWSHRAGTRSEHKTTVKASPLLRASDHKARPPHYPEPPRTPPWLGPASTFLRNSSQNTREGGEQSWHM